MAAMHPASLRRSYSASYSAVKSSINASTEVAPLSPRDRSSSSSSSAEEGEGEEDAHHAILSFIPLLRFQTDKLFGVVAKPVFLAVAFSLLAMNVLTIALPACGVPLVDPGNGANLNRAMAGFWQTVAFTAGNLVILKWHALLQGRVQALVPESLMARLRRRCGGGGGAAGSGVEEPSWLDVEAAKQDDEATGASPSGAARVLPRASSAPPSAGDARSTAESVYLSHGGDSRDERAAQNLKSTLGDFRIWISKDMQKSTESWEIESHISEAMAASKTFVALVSQAALVEMASAHDEWNLTVMEWEIALELQKNGEIIIMPAVVGDVGLSSQDFNFSEDPPKCGKESMRGEDVGLRSVKAIAEDMLRLAENSVRLTQPNTSADGGRPDSLMLSYRVTETGDPADTRDSTKQGDNFTPKLQKALQARGYSCFVGEKQLEAGDEWATTIARAIKGCRAMLIVSSPTYGETKWTFRELQMADNNQKKLIPIYHSGKFPPNDKVEMFLGGTQYIDFRTENHSHTFEEKVSELVAKLKKQKIFPDIYTADGSDKNGASRLRQGSQLLQPTQSQSDYEVQSLADTLRERLEMLAMLDASEQSTSARSVQLWKLLDEELESSRDHKMRVSMATGRDNTITTMKYLAWASTLVMYVFGPVCGVVAGMAVQQRMEADDDIQFQGMFGRVFLTLRLWLFVVFVSQFAVSLLFLTVQLFAVESHLNALLAKRLAVMLGNPREHFGRWEGVSIAVEYDAQYTLLTSTYDNMSADYESMLTISVVLSHLGAVAWIVHFFSFPDSSSICSYEAVQVLSIQLLMFYAITMAPFLCCFKAPYAQSASSTLLAAVRRGPSERFDWNSGGNGAAGRMQLIMYMQSNPVAWRIYGLSITLAGGRGLALIILLADLAIVMWRLRVNHGLSRSAGWAVPTPGNMDNQKKKTQISGSAQVS